MGEKSDNYFGCGTLDNVNDILYFVWWISPEERHRVLQTDTQLTGSFCKYSHAIVTIVIIGPNCSNPSPIKVLDQLGKSSALVVVAWYCSEERWVFYFITETSTGGKMTDLWETKES